ncbi:hypothetical protein EFT54_14340 [Lacticaseibacillus paracasei]|nr:hypothetical protein [Lacticaseibacillus paracasei]
MLCKHHFSKNGQVFFHIFWVVTLIMQSRFGLCCIGFWAYTSQYHPSICKYGVTINCHNGLLQ